jgi:hypothetical protein
MVPHFCTGEGVSNCAAGLKRIFGHSAGAEPQNFASIVEPLFGHRIPDISSRIAFAGSSPAVKAAVLDS